MNWPFLMNIVNITAPVTKSEFSPGTQIRHGKQSYLVQPNKVSSINETRKMQNMLTINQAIGVKRVAQFLM